MMKRKAIYVKWGADLTELNKHLEEHWEVETITAQTNSFTEDTDTRGFLIILKKEEN